MAKWNKGLIFALEELDEQTNQRNFTATGFDSIENDLLDMTNQHDETVLLQDKIQQAAQGADELTAISQVLADEEASAPALQIARISVESIHRRLHIKSSRMPSFEAFDAKKTVDAIKNTAKAIWQKIIEAVKHAWGMVTEFFKKMFSVNEKLKKKNNDLAEELKNVENLKDLLIQQVDLPDAKWTHLIVTNGKVSPVDFCNALEKLKKLMDNTHKIGVDCIGAVEANVEYISTYAEKEDFEGNGHLSFLKKDFKEYFDYDIRTLGVEGLPGDAYTKYDDTKKQFDIEYEDISKVNFSGIRGLGFSEYNKTSKTCKELIDLVDRMQDASKLSERLFKSYDSKLNNIKDLDKSKMQSISTWIKHTNAFITSIVINIPFYAIRVIAAALYYQEYSVGRGHSKQKTQ